MIYQVIRWTPGVSSGRMIGLGKNELLFFLKKERKTSSVTVNLVYSFYFIRLKTLKVISMTSYVNVDDDLTQLNLKHVCD